VVRHFRPTVLIGASGQHGAFTEGTVRDMLAGCARPIALALSNPTSRTEITPADWIRWTHGAGVIGTGSPFAPVTFEGRSYEIGQGNNALIFPGIGLGATAVEARWLPDEAFTAAAKALYAFTDHSSEFAPIYPSLRELRAVSRQVAVAVATALVEHGAATRRSPDEIERRVTESMWEPRYLPYKAASVLSTIDNR
jgi:malate dehydrogenase (oxaloacetate-decarboxylating)